MSKREIQHGDITKTGTSKVFSKDCSGNTSNKDGTIRTKRIMKSKNAINQIEEEDITSKNYISEESKEG